MRRLLVLVPLALGLAGRAEAQLTVNQATAFGYDGAGANFASAVVPLGNLNAAGTGDYAVGVPRAAYGAEAEAGLVRVVFMSTATTVASTAPIQPNVLLTGDQFGSALAVLTTAPLRLLVGAPGDYGSTGNVAASGAVYVLTLSSAGAVTATDRIDDADIPGLAEDDRFGSAITVLTAGATSRIVVGAPGDNCTAGFDCGSAYVLTYNTATNAVSVVGVIGGAGANGVTTTVAGLAANDVLGSALATAAGTPDVLFLGAPGADQGGSNRGRVYRTTVDAANAVGSFAAYDAGTAALTGLADDDRFGAALATPISGATTYLPDVVVGAPGTSGAQGRFWILDLTGATLTAAQTSPLGGTASGQYAAALSVVGEATGYTGVQVAIGAPGGTSTSAGEGRLLLAALSGNLLPVELAAFTAAATGDRVRLAWRTASETNNAGFAIEQQQDAAWKGVGFVAGRGTTAEAASYAFETPALAPGTYRFRLRQTDLDGTATYSAEVSAEVGMLAAARVVVSPSPARGPAQVTVSVREAQAARVVLYDALGREVAVLFDGDLEAQRAVALPVATAQLPAGTYIVRLVGARVQQAQMFVVAR